MSLSVSFPRYKHTATLRQAGLQAPILLVWSALATCVVVSSLILSQWRLVYTLDDPYIHLAVANVITQGGYGVNLSEYSAPSSSILYALLDFKPTLPERVKLTIF